MSKFRKPKRLFLKDSKDNDACNCVLQVSKNITQPVKVTQKQYSTVQICIKKTGVVLLLKNK